MFFVNILWPIHVKQKVRQSWTSSLSEQIRSNDCFIYCPKVVKSICAWCWWAEKTFQLWSKYSLYCIVDFLLKSMSLIESLSFVPSNWNYDITFYKVMSTAYYPPSMFCPDWDFIAFLCPESTWRLVTAKQTSVFSW